MALNNDVTLKVGFDIDKFQAELRKTNGILNNWGASVTNSIKGLVAGFGFYEIGKQVIEVTSEFQKFEAILTNTLGSNSDAQKALQKIKEFAVSTPFEVSEITAAYVRWANMGLTPTIDRMRKLGDIASSLGAGFEQTAEAFKDLMVGQTKRIEEVGISATQANGKIQLSFKGVNIEIEKSAEGVQKALDVYSQLNGVLGTSDAISKTLGGRISNLKDVWSQFMQTLGEGNKGVLYQVVESMTKIVAAMTNFSKEAALIGQALSPFHDLRDVSKETLDYLMQWGRTDMGTPVKDLLAGFDMYDFDAIKTSYISFHDTFMNLFLQEGESVADAGVLWDAYYAKRKKSYEDDNLVKAQDAAASKLAAEKAAAEAAAKAYNELFHSKAKSATSIPVGSTSLGNANIGGVSMPGQVGAPVDIPGMIDANALSEKASQWQEYVDQISEMNAHLRDSFIDLGVNVLEVIGSKLGDANMNIGAGLKMALGKFMSMIGGMFIKFALASKAFQSLLKNIMNPVAPGLLLAAGAALVVAGSAISSAASRGPGGGGGGYIGGGGGGAGREMVNASTQSQQRYVIELKLKGSDAVALIDTAKLDNRQRKG